MKTQLISSRTAFPDISPLRATIRTVTSDGTALVYPTEPFHPGLWTVETLSPLSPANQAACVSAINGAADYTPQRKAQDVIDGWPIELRALVLALIDQLNVIRAALVPPKVAITPAQALQAVRDKAATL